MIVDSIDDDDSEEREIPLPNVSGDILSKVIEFCTYYIQNPMTEFEKVVAHSHPLPLSFSLSPLLSPLPLSVYYFPSIVWFSSPHSLHLLAATERCRLEKSSSAILCGFHSLANS
jgi:hypothetical protein